MSEVECVVMLFQIKWSQLESLGPYSRGRRILEVNFHGLLKADSLVAFRLVHFACDHVIG
jgi:hypothetical protein